MRGREATVQQIEDFKAKREDVEALAALLARRELELREREAEAASAETFAESARRAWKVRSGVSPRPRRRPATA